MHHFRLPCCFYVGSNKERLFFYNSCHDWCPSGSCFHAGISPGCFMPKAHRAAKHCGPQIKMLSVALSWHAQRLLPSTLKPIASSSLFCIFILSATNASNTERSCSFHSVPVLILRRGWMAPNKQLWKCTGCVPRLPLGPCTSQELMSCMFCFQVDFCHLFIYSLKKAS